MAKMTPMQLVEKLYGGKEKLVDKLMGMMDRQDESKEDFRSRLLAASNSKLLRLHDVIVEMTEKFGNKTKLVDSILSFMNKAKDKDYRAKLAEFTPVRLMGMYKEWAKRTRKKGKEASA